MSKKLIWLVQLKISFVLETLISHITCLILEFLKIKYMFYRILYNVFYKWSICFSNFILSKLSYKSYISISCKSNSKKIWYSKSACDLV
jgi:hypothetical protein